MGLLIGMGSTSPAYPYDYFYGVKININTDDPVLTRVGRADLHVSLPVQSQMRRCLLADDGTVTAYLDASDSTKTDTGADADLTGASGMYMVEFPEHYRKFEFDGADLLALISPYPLPGFHKVRKMYRSAVQATTDKTDASKPKLASVVNTTAEFRGGTNNSSWDGTYRSLLGMPVTGTSLTTFRKYARNRGEYGMNGCGWNCDTYEAMVNTFWLYVIEYANRNSQAAFNAEPTSEGYKQGGLGAGVTTWDGTWGTYNSYNPIIPCGTTNSLGNATGVVPFTVKNDDESITKTFDVPSYRGIENPFGHIWLWVDGAHIIETTAEEGNKRLFYRAIDDDPANFNDDVNNDGYILRGEVSRSSGFIKRILGGEYGDILPLTTGAGSTSYYCDYWYVNTSAPTTNTLRGVLLGGCANNGATCGLANVRAYCAPADAVARIGSRLCYIP